MKNSLTFRLRICVLFLIIMIVILMGCKALAPDTIVFGAQSKKYVKMAQ